MQNQVYLATIILGVIFIGTALVYFEKLSLKKVKNRRDAFFKERLKYSREEFLSDLASLGYDEKVGDSLMKSYRAIMDDNDEEIPFVYLKPDDDLVKTWGIDEEKSDILTAMLSDFGINKRIKWNQKEVLNLKTTKDLLGYFSECLEDRKD